ncbi:hypothetical protein SERLADRAFT_406457 [Serpula lacrymans var. lacrymans S7.9]|uniref:Uncharacterized protein n=1 Tax=Serpula lacrymans var. lacrymans (strain S7.9) TaxID=578457 RepID=F8NM70_SERL9|nr:uncharacterized protein SERLADRAFT_406457 [Serpula lacrymans var. lacrymans S7.9]EGO27320.1 hypothetical protein SERLADRAFT_406457 [Serpula lacrymans var. lacrymans S7.9]
MDQLSGRSDSNEGTMEVAYEANDLYLKNRSELVALVHRQINKWPFDGNRKFSSSKTAKALIMSVLLEPKYGFTKVISVTASNTPAVALKPTTAGWGSSNAILEVPTCLELEHAQQQNVTVLQGNDSSLPHLPSVMLCPVNAEDCQECSQRGYQRTEPTLIVQGGSPAIHTCQVQVCAIEPLL